MGTNRQFERFADLAALRPEDLRTILAEGDPSERVWAAWALGLAMGESVAEELQSMAALDPVPGVRAKLAIVLAAHGEAEAVRSMATSDPDDEVRATACTYLSRTARRPSDVAPLLEHRFDEDEAWQVQMALLRLALEGQIALTASQAARAASQPDITLRRLGLEYGVRHHPAAMFDRTWLEDDRDMRKSAVRAVVRELGADALLARIQEAGVDAGVTLEALPAHKARWSSVQFLADRRTPDDDLRAMRLLDPADVRPAIPWVIGAAGRETNARRGGPPRWEAVNLLVAARDRDLQDGARSVAPGLISRAIAMLQADLEETRKMAEFEDELAELEASEWYAERQNLIRTLSKLLRAATRGEG